MLLFVGWAAGREIQTGFGGKKLDRLRKVHVPCLLHERDKPALGMATEAIIESLVVRDAERRRLLVVERAIGPIFTLGRLGLSLVPRDNLPGNSGERHARFDLVDECGREFHANECIERVVLGKRLFRQLNSLLQPTGVNVEYQNLIGVGHYGIPIRASGEGGRVNARRQLYFGR